MADLKTTLCGIEIDSPFVLASGPVGFGAEGLIAAAKAGAGAVVTKSIAYKGVINNTLHMVSPAPNVLMNNEGGSDEPLEYWLEEIPKAKAGGVKCLIASIGGTAFEETVDIAGKLMKAGSDILEIVVDYHEAGDLVERIKALKKAVNAPLLVKVNANWKNTAEMADLCSHAGADGITAIDSVGPVMRIDISTGKTMLGGKGYGYMTGAPILPIALRVVYEIASGAKKPVEIVGTGGVMNGKNALEMLMAGATGVGICTLPIIKGTKAITNICKELSDVMDQYGYKSISEVSGKAVKTDRLPNKSVSDFKFDPEKCNYCGICETACPYGARKLLDKDNRVDSSRCRICGLCFTLCPKKAIFIE